MPTVQTTQRNRLTGMFAERLDWGPIRPNRRRRPRSRRLAPDHLVKLGPLSRFRRSKPRRGKTTSGSSSWTMTETGLCTSQRCPRYSPAMILLLGLFPDTGTLIGSAWNRVRLDCAGQRRQDHSCVPRHRSCSNDAQGAESRPTSIPHRPLCRNSPLPLLRHDARGGRIDHPPRLRILGGVLLGSLFVGFIGLVVVEQQGKRLGRGAEVILKSVEI